MGKYSGIIVPFLLCAPAHAAVQPNWKYYQPVQIRAARPVKIKLSYDLLDRAAAGLADLRVFDEEGGEVPYIIAMPSGENPRDLAPLRFAVAAERAQTVITAAADPSKYISAVALETAARDFMKSASVQISTDGARWLQIARARPVFRQDGRENLAVDFPRGAYAHIRVTLDDAHTAPIAVTGLKLRTPGSEPAGLETLRAADIKITLSKNRKDYRFSLPAKNLYVQDIGIASGDRTFSRLATLSVERQTPSGGVQVSGLGEFTLYRLFFDKSPMVERVKIPVRKRLDGAGAVTVSITEPLGRSFTLSRIETRVAPVYLEFYPQKPGTYMLGVGNPLAEKPDYNTEALSREFSRAKLAAHAAGQVRENPDFFPARAPVKTADSGAELDVSKWPRRALLEPQTKGLQYLELTPLTLSRSMPSLADLRLESGGKQVPYMIAASVISRKLVPVVTPQPEASKQGLSVWELALPWPGISVSEVTCAVPDSVFEREVRVYEYARDSQGAKRRRDLGFSQWTRTPGQTERKYIVGISRPVSDRLYLEARNGDDEPFGLSEFAVYYSTKRLFFKTDGEHEVRIYYGNRQAAAPRYAVFAESELNSARTEVRLANEETPGKKGWPKTIPPGKTERKAYWFLLAVAAALIVAAVKLLPGRGAIREAKAGRKGP